MTTIGQRVRATIAGRTVEGRVIDEDVEAHAATGPQRILRIEAGRATYRVPEADATPV